ncbi:hypothetical protein COB57_05825 [Candidatus Peregrinibacteria bacterium]|nr:MAG: hypothetical protein COB57_05825 [Candidatus Peregrinibacteria bacterium]
MHNVKILIPANFSFSTAIREIAKESGILAGFQQKQQNMLRLVVDELFMNAIRYGSNKESHIFVEAVIQGDSLVFAIEDEGKGETPIKAEDLKKIIQRETDCSNLEKTHGRGLAQITSNLVEAYEIIDKPEGGLRIEFSIKKQKDEEKKEQEYKKRSETILPEKTIELNDEIDMSNMENIITQVESLLHKHEDESFRLIFDFQKLSHCNSSFLGKLAEWHNNLSQKKGEIIIKQPSKTILEIIELVGLHHIFIIEQ